MQETQPLVRQFGRAQVLNAIQGVLTDIRREAAAGKPVDLSENSLVKMVTNVLETCMNPSLARVINASGVILHTNLGRAPLSNAAISHCFFASSSIFNE